MGSKVSLEVRGFNEARAAFRSLVAAMDPSGSSPGAYALYRVAQKEIQNSLASAAVTVRDKARANAAGGATPRRLHGGARPAIFAFSDFNAGTDDKRKRGVLIGVRTGLSPRAPDRSLYIQWGAGSRRHKGGTIAQRGLSMSFGALFERGTKSGRIRARHYFTSAAATTKSVVQQLVTSAYRKAVDLLNHNTP